jgi:asparagine synthase (glutamine-hydrolysing)
MELVWKPQHKDPVYRWYVQDGVAVRGYACLPDDTWVQGAGLAAFFSDAVNQKTFAEKVHALNGSFAVVIDKAQFFAVAVDRLRTFPVFYYDLGEKVFITDHLEADAPHLNPDAVPAFRALYCTEGSSTLLQGWRQLLAGQYIWVEKAAHHSWPDPTQYYLHAVQEKWTSKELTTDAINAVHKSVMKRQVASTAGRPVAILLSGGYDSRWLIAEWRVRHKGPLYAITYGKSRSYDTITAEQIARKLLVKWLYVPYAPSLLDHFDGKGWAHYHDFNHTAVSTPYEQDFFAIQYIKEQGWIPDDTIIVPGFCGDLLGGSIFDVFKHEWSLQGMGKFIAEKYGVDLIPELPPSMAITDRESFWDAWQHWFVVNRVSKFLVNGVRAYSCFGYEWRLPLWDNELVDFWYKVPLKKRIGQDLYEDWLWMKAFRPLDLDDWDKPSTDANSDNNRLKAWLRKQLPPQWVARYKQRQLSSGRLDPNNLHYLYHKLNERLINPIVPPTYNFNDAHARYILEKYWTA